MLRKNNYGTNGNVIHEALNKINFLTNPAKT